LNQSGRLAQCEGSRSLARLLARARALQASAFGRNGFGARVAPARRVAQLAAAAAEL